MLGPETKSKILQESDPSVVLDETQRGAGGEKIFSRFFPVWELSFYLEHWEISSPSPGAPNIGKFILFLATQVL